jgi:hypothetical protein
MILIVIVALAALITVLAARGGPRVTQITRTVHKEKDEGDA